MRILYVTSVYPRWKGDATPPFVENQARLMVEKGFEVRVLAPHAKGASFREVHGALSIRRYAYAFPFGLQKLCYEGGMLVRLKSTPWVAVLLPFLLLSQLTVVAWECFRWRPDLIHSHSLLPQGLVSSVVGFFFKTPHLTTSHGNDVFGLKSAGIMAALKRYVLRSADGITVNSSATRTKILELDSTASGKTYLIPAVANVGEVDANLVQRLRTEYKSGVLIAFVGRLIEEKGIFDLVDALGVLFKESVDFSAVILGDGTARQELERQLTERDLQDRVHLVGWRPSEEIASWMAAADLLAVPSKPVGTWQEAQGLVVVEAMSVGTPVVASRIGGIPDMVVDGETGRLFTAGDFRQLADALKASCADYEECNRMAKKAFDQVALIYAPSSVAELTSELYEQILNKNSSVQ